MLLEVDIRCLNPSRKTSDFGHFDKPCWCIWKLKWQQVAQLLKTILAITALTGINSHDICRCVGLSRQIHCQVDPFVGLNILICGEGHMVIVVLGWWSLGSIDPDSCFHSPSREIDVHAASLVSVDHVADESSFIRAVIWVIGRYVLLVRTVNCAWTERTVGVGVTSKNRSYGRQRLEQMPET